VFRESSRSTNREDAERLLKRRQGEVVTGQFLGLGPERVTVGELLDAVLDDYRLRDRASLRTTAARVKKNLYPYFAKLRVAEFATRHVRDYTLLRKKQGAANATINRELQILHRAFRLAYEADPPMVARVPHVPLLPEDNVRTGILDHAGYLRLRDLLPSPYRLLLVLGYHTGARLGELLGLRWSQVDLERGEIRLEAHHTKTRKARVLPIYGEMRHCLEMARVERDLNCPQCPWVFQVGGERMIFNWRTWRAFAQRAGVPNLRFHDLRRTALTNMVRAGVPEKEAMEISGHLTRKTFERYHIVSDRTVRDVGEKMDRFLREETAKVGAGTSTISDTIGASVSSKLLN
jgi:integrase